MFEALADSLDPATADLLVKSLNDDLAAKQVIAAKQQERIGEASRRVEWAATEGLGELQMRVSADSYWFWHFREKGCWDDEGFRREFRRDNEDCRIKLRPRKESVGWTPAIAKTEPLIVEARR